MADVEEEKLAKLLQVYVKYTESAEVLFLKSFKELRDKHKVLVYLAARLGLKFLNSDGNVGITGKKIHENLNMSYSSVRVYLHQLRSEGLVVVNEQTKEYKIASQGVLDMEDMLKEVNLHE